MPRFRQDNTEGYSDADLAAMNEAFERIVAEDHYCDMPDPKSAADHLAESIQSAYDSGSRGVSLLLV